MAYKVRLPELKIFISDALWKVIANHWTKRKIVRVKKILRFVNRRPDLNPNSNMCSLCGLTSSLDSSELFSSVHSLNDF